MDTFEIKYNSHNKLKRHKYSQVNRQSNICPLLKSKTIQKKILLKQGTYLLLIFFPEVIQKSACRHIFLINDDRIVYSLLN